MVQDATTMPQPARTLPAAGKPRLRTAQPSLHGVKSLLVNAVYFAGSIAILLGLWTTLCFTFARDLPTPWVTARALAVILSHPFYVNSDGSMGIGNLIYASLGRVFIGFGVASAIAIPLGIAIGSFPVARRLFDPIAAMLRPVSPLAWFPLSQVIFRALGDGTTPAAITATIALCSLWPTLMNTALGVSSLPAEFRSVAHVFQFSPTRYLAKVLLPYTLPYIVAGLRLSLGLAWLVIVAAEMLSGSSGVGFSAYDAYNNGRLDEMVATIIVIGVIGLVLDRGFDWLQRRMDYQNRK